MKKFWSTIMSLCIMLALFSMPTAVSASVSGTFGDNLTWMLDDDGTLTIGGNGKMDFVYYAMDSSWYSSGAPWEAESSNIKAVVIENGVINIGAGAFNDCENLKSVTIPESVTGIGEGAFYGCKSLEYITIPESVEWISCCAFQGCESLKSIIIPDGVEVIYTYAFFGCNNLENIIIPANVYIEGGALQECDKLTNVYYGGNEENWKMLYSRYMKSAFYYDEYDSVKNAKIHFSDIGAVLDVLVNINDSILFFDQPPVIENGRTLVPLRAICEWMGAEVEWIAETNQVKVSLGGVELVFTVNNPIMIVNGKEKILDQPPIVLNGRTLLPARAFLEELGAKVDWDNETRTVVINYEYDYE